MIIRGNITPLVQNLWTKKNLSTSHYKPPFQCLVIGIQEITQAMYVIAVSHGFLPEIKYKSLLLKIQCTLETGLQGIQLDLLEMFLFQDSLS